LHAFNGSDGQDPASGVIQASDGNFYGSTVSGTGSGQSYGTVFRFGRAGLTTLYRFVTGGGQRLIQADDGRLYGTTPGGGAYGWGSIFRISLSGDFLTLHSFLSGACCGSPDPSPLIQASDGSISGTIQDMEAGPSTVGTIFALTRTGQFITSPYFSKFYLGQHPIGIIQASDGTFYGYMQVPPSYDWVIFQGGWQQAPQVLYTFQDGARPVGALGSVYGRSAALLQTSSGALIGVMASGGTNNTGYVFRLQLGLPLPSAAITSFTPQTAAPGRLVGIVGRNFVGTKNVQFNGVTTAFKVMSPTVVFAVVPSGATSGKISLTNLAGSTVSTTDFTVQ
jgi:uncharacterized repeat protein (TIGR03803 family)